MSALFDLADDPGLVPTRTRGPHGPYVGTVGSRSPARFAAEPALDRVLRELAAGFGPQRWWPATTPFEVALGAVLTQNTAWRNVELALARLAATTRLTPASLLALAPERLEQAVRPSGTYRAKARKLRELCRFWLAIGGLATLRRAPLGEIRGALLGVWGIGPETADSILCYAAGRASPVVDAYARRVLGRHGLVDPDLPYEELRAWLLARLVRAQAVIEEFHALCVRAGADHCKPAARCETCPAPTPTIQP
jgi:endonuclease-3 related protein